MKLLFNKYQHFTDEDLMKLLADGDEKAFSEIYERYKDRLFYFFFRMLNNQKDKAEDFLHDVFLKVIQQPGAFDAQKSFSTWIFTIAYNLCKNDYRHLEVVKRFADELSHEDIVVDETCKNRETQLQDFSRLIFEEIKYEDAEHKTCFLLFYREGFTLEEIQECTGATIGTVKSRLYYTRKRLKNRLEKKYPEFIKNIQYEF